MSGTDVVAQRRAKLAARRAELSLSKRGRLEEVLRRASSGNYKAEVIPRRPPGEPVPLSFAQQRLWFLDQLDPGKSLYNMPAAVRLAGRINIAGLKQSINEIVRRHEALRTNFANVDGQTVQLISTGRRAGLLLVDLGGLSADEWERQARRLAWEEGQRPYNLASQSLLRATLLRRSVQEHAVLLTMHHIVSDAWSWGIFTREVGTLYKTYCKGRPSPLSEPIIQYADYSYWQRQLLQGETLEAELAYWKQQLDGLSIVNLPTDRPRPALQSFRGAAKGLAVPEKLTDALRRLSRQEEVTLFITLLAAFQILLSRYSGQEDIVVGTPMAGRSRVETEALIGFFINTLVLRTKLSGEPSARELIGRVREVVLGAQTHQDLPFEKLVEELQPERSLSHSPLFQIMFSVPNAPTGSLREDGDSVSSLDELRFDNLNPKQDQVRFDLTLTMMEAGNTLRGFFDYNLDLFDRSTVARMAGQFQTLLEHLVVDPSQSLLTLPLLTRAERHQALIEWNDTQHEDASESSMHELFEQRALFTPEAIALRFEQQHLSYRELNRRANQLANYLTSKGGGIEGLVGLYMERSLEMVVGMLAVLKAGGAYVPMDPAYPAERLAYMLDDSKAAIVLTCRKQPDEVPQSSAEVVSIDREWEEIEKQSDASRAANARGENLAYVIYTSGSTGRPKGVAVSHKGLVNIINGLTRQPGLCAGDVFLALTSLSFDISMLEIFWPLANGASVVIASKEDAADGRRLINLLADCAATHMQATPASWRLLLDDGWSGQANLKVFCGGEALPRDIADSLIEASRHVWNMYGPTETTIWSATARVENATAAVSIGRPIANTQIYILDKSFQPVPIGVAGELYIGGDGLARGYLNRTDMTAERFTLNVAGDEPGRRIYRTGDVARFRQEGSLEFLGRGDHQVKIRGFRIELGEIESALNQHPEVAQAVVVARDNRSGGQRLVAYFVSRQKLSDRELQRHLRATLPDYMVPSAFVQMEEFPLTANGKINRQALPEPEVGKGHPTRIDPRNSLEEILCGIWSDVLRAEQVYVNQNFFELGGHSLLATRVVSRVRDQLGVDVPLRALFEGPTVAEFAVAVEQAQSREQGLEAPPIRPVSRAQTLPLSYAQQRLWFFEQLMPFNHLYNLPTAIRLLGTLNVAALEASLGQIIRRHESLRTRFVETDGQPAQIISEAQPIKLPVVDFGRLQGPQRDGRIQKLIGEEARRPFHLAAGPHLRARLLKIGEQDHVFLLTMHHIVSDGWSMALLIKEIISLYENFNRGEASGLTELSVHYADFALWQREWLAGDVLEAQLKYWQEQLGGQLPVLNLPTDRPRPAVSSYRGTRQPIAISKPTSDRVKALSRKEGATLYMTLLAAFGVLLHRYSDQADIVVGTDVANRNRGEIEGLIGFFVNQLVMRVDLSGNPTFRELLGRVRRVALGAYAHQDLPFERLVEALRPERLLSRAPLFQVKMILQNIPVIQDQRDVMLDRGLAIGMLDGGSSETAQLDMNMILQDTPRGIAGSLAYSTDLFRQPTVALFLKNFESILDWASTEPTLRVSELVERINITESQQLTSRRDEIQEARRRKRQNLVPRPVSGLKLS